MASLLARVQALQAKDYSYVLPDERIARHPAATRDGAKLLVYQQGQLFDKTFKDLPAALPAGSLLVRNTTRVLPARLALFKDTGARIELFCLGPLPGVDPQQAYQQQGQVHWQCLVGNRKRWKEGQAIAAAHGELRLEAWLEEELEEGFAVRLRWAPNHLSFAEVLERMGEVPLPPYLKREAEAEDKDRYQTVFAKYDGAVAAPTASLHFTEALLEQLQQAGHALSDVLLHVGAGTFKPMDGGTLAKHAMHAEYMAVTTAALSSLTAGRPVIPLGTTALRTVETLYWLGVGVLHGQLPTPGGLLLEQWQAYTWLDKARVLPSKQEALQALLAWMNEQQIATLAGETQLLIAPGYTYKVATGLVTNFHQPGSTLLLLVAALLGKDWHRVYDHALSHGYRFLSYGDGSLLLP